MKYFAPLVEKYPQLQVISGLALKKNSKVYLVGGCLRDTLLQRECCDLDFCMKSGAIDFAQSVSEKLKGTFILLDQERGCARVAKKVRGQLWTFDFSDFKAKTLKGDLGRRDFTINTLWIDAAKPGVQKFDQTVLNHLKRKRIEMVNSKVFVDDPLRLMRAFSLKASLGFTIERKTLAQIKKDKQLIHQVSPERIREELFKILNQSNTAEIFKQMDQIGLLGEVIPQIEVMRKVTQGGYHHLDVWPHSLEAVRQLDLIVQEMNQDGQVIEYLQEKLGSHTNRRSLMKLATLLHDIGKPETKITKEGKTSFHGHEHVGKRIVRSVAKMLKLSIKQRRALEDMVLYHLRPGYLSNFKSPSKKMIFRYFRDTKDEALSILLLSLADQRATCGPLTSQHDQDHHEKIILRLAKEFLKKRKEKPFVRLINGKDLIKHLKLKPSPMFKEILTKVEEQQVLGKLSSKDEALDYARGCV